MQTNEFVNILKDLIYSWDQNNSGNSDAALEIKMWRKYFLQKELKPYSDAKKSSIEHDFMNFPSSSMHLYSPKELLRKIEAEYENK